MQNYRFHISQDGVARECHAKTPESCTAASPETNEHYATKEAAQQEYERKQSKEWLRSVSVSSKKAQKEEPVRTKETVAFENKKYVDQIKLLEREKKQAKTQIEKADILAQQNDALKKLLDNAWDQKEKTGSEKDLKKYKSVRNKSIKMLRKEVEMLETEQMTWETIYLEGGRFLNKRQWQRVRDVKARQKEAEVYLDDLVYEVLIEKNKLGAITY